MKHEDSCTLGGDHYGPCAETSREVWVEHPETGAILWRAPCTLETMRAVREEAIAQAWRLRGFPLIRHHARWTDAVEFPIPVREATPRGDLILSLPWGEYGLVARRDERTDSPPVTLYGRINRGAYGVAWHFQPSHIVYEDKTRSEWLGCYPRDLNPVEDFAADQGAP